VKRKDSQNAHRGRVLSAFPFGRFSLWERDQESQNVRVVAGNKALILPNIWMGAIAQSVAGKRKDSQNATSGGSVCLPFWAAPL
jgi:hypothetical protein